MKEAITWMLLTNHCIITSQRPLSFLLPSNAGQISQLPNWDSCIFMAKLTSSTGKTAQALWLREHCERKKKPSNNPPEMLICINASKTTKGSANEIFLIVFKTCWVLRQHGWPVEGKSGRARSWGYGNPGKTPGAGGRLNRSSFPFMSSLWGSSCICCRHK